MKIDLKNGIYFTLNYDVSLDRIRALSTLDSAIKALKASKIPDQSVSLCCEYSMYTFIYFEDGFIHITNGMEDELNITLSLDQKMYTEMILEILEKIKGEYKAV